MGRLVFQGDVGSWEARPGSFQPKVFQGECIGVALADQLQSALYGSGRAVPRGAIGCGFGATAQAGPKAGLHGQSSTVKVADIILCRCPCGTNGPTINTGGMHCNVEFTVKAHISGQSGPATHLGVETTFVAGFA